MDSCECADFVDRVCGKSVAVGYSVAVGSGGKWVSVRRLRPASFGITAPTLLMTILTGKFTAENKNFSMEDLAGRSLATTRRLVPSPVRGRVTLRRRHPAGEKIALWTIGDLQREESRNELGFVCFVSFVTFKNG